MNFWSIVGFLQTGLLWISTGVSLLWIFRRIDDNGAVRLLTPVLILLATSALAVGFGLGMELFVARYSGAIYEMEAMQVRLTGPYWWAYWLRFAASLVPVAFLVPRVRRSMPMVAGLSFFSFTVVFAERLIGMATGGPS